ncbi:hypothetical protein [Achromobacter xylosoxidans]|uniref:hypothetical protein n=1 Tax=Alcaligenes xylosoxydans xylosoxydans TaxID=85698 RepID=UPI001F142C8B|nr:hypothetical protein [Achromobacter xylosoxidans]
MNMRWIRHDEEGTRLPGDFALMQEGPGEWVEAETIPPLVPQTVSAAQGGIALIRAGLMETVLAVVQDDSTPAEVRWAFQKAQEWSRSSDALNYLANKAQISGQQLDELFLEASALKA